jgi:hypothetical protein
LCDWAEMSNSTDKSGREQEEENQQQSIRDLDWWKKRAKHFESEYKREKAKRQEYEKLYGESGE